MHTVRGTIAKLALLRLLLRRQFVTLAFSIRELTLYPLFKEWKQIDWPNTHALVCGLRDNVIARWRVGNVDYNVRMTFEDMNDLACLNIPEDSGLIFGTGEQALAIV